jgi:hypothetical protein
MTKEVLIISNDDLPTIIKDSKPVILNYINNLGLDSNEYALCVSPNGNHKLYNSDGDAQKITMQSQNIRKSYLDSVCNFIEITTKVKNQNSSKFPGTGHYLIDESDITTVSYVSIVNGKRKVSSPKVTPETTIRDMIVFALEHIEFDGNVDDILDEIYIDWNSHGWNLLFTDGTQLWMVNQNGVIDYGSDY